MAQTTQSKEIVDLMGRWQVRFETTNRVFNSFWRLFTLAIFCKVFNFPPWGYLVSVIAMVIVFVGLSYVLDKIGLLFAIDKAWVKRSAAWQEVLGKLKK